MTDGVFNYYDSDTEMRKIMGLRDWYKLKKMAFALPERTTEICNDAFMRCEATAFMLPDGLETIGANAFYFCENLKIVFIPKGVKTIRAGAFEGCNKLEIYCEGEPAEGWIAQEPEYRTETVNMPEDYAFDFHRGGVSATSREVKIVRHWNPDNRPVHKNYSREKFIKKLNAYIKP